MEPLYKPTKSIREYFDGFAHEFSYSIKKDKLAEIANCVYHGYDFLDELNEQCVEHPDRTKTICGTISNYGYARELTRAILRLLTNSDSFGVVQLHLIEYPSRKKRFCP